MKVLYFGTVCDMNRKDPSIGKEHVSNASVVFESNILSGFKAQGADVDVYSFPMIPNFSISKVIGWGSKKEGLECGYAATWIPTVNIAGLKQVSRWFFAKGIIKKWLKENKNEHAVVLLYSVCPFIAPSVVKLCKKYNKRCIAIVPDLPENMYMNHRLRKSKAVLAQMYLRPAINVQSMFDGYVFLTESMKEAIGVLRPYVIVEGIVDDTCFLEPEVQKSTPKAIMYAGRLHERYGLKNLIEAYLRTPHNNTELWLFGSGSFEPEIEKYVAMDASIKFFGSVKRDIVLDYEQRASLLVNCRDPMDEYVKYSFPSKTMEYMASGTPVYTTMLPGIPPEYKEYLFTTQTNSVEDISNMFHRVLNMPESELKAFGTRAKEFVFREKNATKQAEKIISLINEVLEL